MKCEALVPIGSLVRLIDDDSLCWKLTDVLFKETETLYHLFYIGEGCGEHYANDFEILEYKTA